MSERTDPELLQAWRDGEQRAGNELFDRHFDVLYHFFARKVGDAADDLVQQTFAACLRAKVIDFLASVPNLRLQKPFVVEGLRNKVQELLSLRTRV